MSNTPQASFPFLALVGAFRDMILNEITLLKLIKTPEKPEGQSEAMLQQERIRMHGKPNVRDDAKRATRDSSSALNRLLQMCRTMLPRDKYRTLLGLVREPLDTVTLTGEAYQQLQSCFDGADRNVKYSFSADELETDYQDYRAKMGGEDGFRAKGMDTLRCRPNCVSIVDLPPEQVTARPEPYYYTRELSTLHSYRIGDNRVLDFAVWIEKGEDDQEIAYVLDAEAYSTWRVTTTGEVSVTELTRNEHNLGYCPARTFWTDAIDSTRPLVIRHPLTDFLAKLDWCQITHWLKRFGDLFNAFPITTTYQQTCTFSEEKRECIDGYLRNPESGNYYIDDDNGLLACPACKDRHNIGPGTHYEVPLPGPANGDTSLIPAVGITSVDTGSLKYNAENLKAQEESIFAGIVGSVFDAINNQAVNEKQVESLFESRRKSLMTVARNFEQLQEWIEGTICKLRYGDAFKGLSVNYGTEFFLFTPANLLAIYTVARDNGLDPAILDNLQWLYYQTRFRRQPDELERARLLIALDPARHHTPTSAATLFAAGLITRNEYGYKMNQSSLVDRFETEQMPITSYRDKYEWPKRIDAIRTILYSYLPPEPTTPAGQQTNDNSPAGQPAQPMQ